MQSDSLQLSSTKIYSSNSNTNNTNVRVTFRNGTFLNHHQMLNCANEKEEISTTATKKNTNTHNAYQKLEHSIYE